MPTLTDDARNKLTNLFSFFKAVELRRGLPLLQVDQRPWKLQFSELPQHHTLHVQKPVGEQPFKLHFTRPETHPCPVPPDALDEWLQPAWDDPAQPTVHLDSIKQFDDENVPYDAYFDAVPERVNAWREWQTKRSAWAEVELPARKALAAWERLFAVHSQLEREGEALELMLADGVFAHQGIHHPLLLRRVELSFDPKTREFCIEDAQDTSEFYAPVFANAPNMPVKRWQQQVIDGELHPLGGQGVDDWLQGVVGAFQNGVWFKGEPPTQCQVPHLGRAPLFFLRKREAGRIEFLNKILDDLAKCVDAPDSLLRIVGCPPTLSPLSLEPDNNYANEDTEILLTKPANAAQLSILRRLHVRDGVLVQGPPGTGKTHTIANLIGSLLAEGKSVLVTSHTTKALRVLRDQVVKPLRSLCVSALDSDLASKKELENAVKELSAGLDRSPDQMDREADQLARERAALLNSTQATRHDIETAIQGEYRALVVDSEEIDPVVASKEVAAGVGQHDWIPGTVEDRPLPLSDDALRELYQSSTRIAPSDEAELEKDLPARDHIWPPSQFDALVDTLAALAQRDLDLRRDYWIHPTDDSEFDAALEQIAQIIKRLGESEPWRLAALQAGMDGNNAAAVVWRSTCDTIEATRRIASEATQMLFEHSPTFTAGVDTATLGQTLDAIIAHLGAGKSLSALTLMMHPAWKRCIAATRIQHAGQVKPPFTLAHFQALRKKLDLVDARATLVARWREHMEPHGLPSLVAQQSPEDFVQQYVADIHGCLDWHNAHWMPATESLKAHGLDWDRLAAEAPQVQSANHHAERLHHAVTELLPTTLETEQWRRLRDSTLEALAEYETLLGAWPHSPAVRKLLDAVRTRAPLDYQTAYDRLAGLLDLKPDFDLRTEHLAKLNPAAPDWANAIKHRQGQHGASQLPGDAAQAWRWKKLNQELDRRAKLDVPALQANLERLGNDLKATTAKLVERRAWAALIRRVSQNDDARQALLGWAKTTKKLGSGTVRNADTLKRQAANEMGKARAAVPVWIMPFSRLTQNFDPVRDRFDVLIVDEASQEDVVGLAPFYMADKVIVVGDDEQVTPLDVGGEQQPIQDLIQQWLVDLPSPLLFDLKTSVYDRAHLAFGTAILLKEHFRCVPEIIQFSNWLSYNGEIRPLRESASTPLKPALVAHRIQGFKQGKKNLAEAEAIACLVAAAIEQPEYAGKSFGIISLVGDEQAREIETRLRSRIDITEYEQRRILCGNPAHFQGDERDVIFLSVVDSKDDGEGPLSMRGDGQDALWKKRYNVATSRAKDQLWVVYSLDHATQLKSGDLRRRLIEHSLDPDALMKRLEDGAARTESPFEKSVYERLVAQGYKVITQWQVGAYRIDLVVVGDNGKRLAVECDGDRWHYDKVAEDMARQALLERLGWHFARIRGTVFYRDPKSAMRTVLDELDKLGIIPCAASLPTTAQHSALLDAVKRKAAELCPREKPSQDALNFAAKDHVEIVLRL